LFWKKKSERPYVRLGGDDRRNAVRINPDDNLSIEIEGQSFQVMDISAGGVSFAAEGIESGSQLSTQLLLRLYQQKVEVRIEVLFQDNQGICHCRFVELSPETSEILHHYILDLQKHAIRNQRIAEV
jgi:c-di-GMP-binding flagellar brake protein YcgR